MMGMNFTIFMTLLKIVVIVRLVRMMMMMLLIGQMGDGVMNSDYESEELYSLVESSSDDELGYDSDDDAEDDRSTHVGNGKGQKNEEVKKFPMFKPVVKIEHISFEKDMMFTTPKQFKEAIREYAFHGGWGICKK